MVCEIACWTWSSKKWVSSFFPFYWKVYFSPWAMGWVKSSSTHYNEWNKPNWKSVTYIGSKKSLVELGVPKSDLFHFFSHFSFYWKIYFSTLSYGFLRRMTIRKKRVSRKGLRFRWPVTEGFIFLQADLMKKRMKLKRKIVNQNIGNRCKK